MTRNTNIFIVALMMFTSVSSLMIDGHVAKDYVELFHIWMIAHNITIGDGEFFRRLSNFVENDRLIDSHNAKNLSYTLGHNQFSHMTNFEFSSHVMCGEFTTQRNNLRRNAKIIGTDTTTGLPTSVDWRNLAVTPVKNQGNCGSCWSFSTTGALEGAYALKYGDLLSFSEQQLVDCDVRNGDHGCNGGLMDNAFNWIDKNNGLCLESDYPYVSGTTSQAGDCQKSCKVVSKADVASHTDVLENSVSSLMKALSLQPVSVAIQADQTTFQLYKNGVLTSDCGDNLDHGVLAVGYDSDDETPYWLVKNSWGTTWGDNGYIKLAMNVDQKTGQCGILAMASYPSL